MAPAARSVATRGTASTHHSLALRPAQFASAHRRSMAQCQVSASLSRFLWIHGPRNCTQVGVLALRERFAATLQVVLGVVCADRVRLLLSQGARLALTTRPDPAPYSRSRGSSCCRCRL